MRYYITIPANGFDERNINANLLKTVIHEHENNVARKIAKNLQYYDGGHAILDRTRKDKEAPNNRVVCNHAKDITDTSTGYFMSTAISYSMVGNEHSELLDKLTDAFDVAETEDVDHDNALDMSRAGVAYEYVFAKEDETVLSSKNLEPTSTFIVYDDSIVQKELFAVYYFKYKEAVSKKNIYKATVATQNYIYNVVFEDADGCVAEISEPISHYLGEIPIIEYCNNKDCIGDYEQQISLIDAYNTLMSDRINDKQQFLDALLVIYGTILGDDEKEVSKALKLLKENGLLEMPDGAKAEYLTRTFDEEGVEVLRNAIKEDIYTFSHVPNLTDENFVGNSSGVAMEYKLLGLEGITKTKDRYYKKGLKKRIRLFCNYLKIKQFVINPTSISISFKRGLPKNMLELAQIISQLKGTVSTKTLISQLDFVEDPDGEIEAVKKETQESVEQQRQMFSVNENTPLQDVDNFEENKESVEK